MSTKPVLLEICVYHFIVKMVRGVWLFAYEQILNLCGIWKLNQNIHNPQVEETSKRNERVNN